MGELGEELAGERGGRVRQNEGAGCEGDRG